MVKTNKKDPVKKIMTLFYLLKFLKIKVNLNLKIWLILKAQNDTFYKKNLQNKTKNKVDNRKKEVDNLYKIDSKEKNNQLQTI